MLIAIVVVAVIIVVGAVAMFRGPKSSSAISTAGNAATETTAPGDHAKGS